MTMEEKQPEKQTLLMSLGLEKSTTAVYDRIAADNMFYSLPVFMPVFLLSLALTVKGGGLMLWVGLLLQLGSGIWLQVSAARGRRSGQYTGANLPMVVHMGTCTFSILAYAASAGGGEDTLFVLFLAFMWIFGLTAIPIAYMILVVFADALAAVLLFPQPLLSVLSFWRAMAVLLSVFYITSLRYYRKSCKITEEEQIRQENVMLEMVSKTDSLTGALNRRGGDEAISAYIRENPAQAAFLVLIEINDFKVFNDLHGREAGNALLFTMMRELRSAFGDIGEIIRNGSSEFTVFLRAGADRQAALDRLKNYVNSRHMFTSDGKSYTFEVTVGYAAYPEHADTVQGLFTRADSALYYAKLYGTACEEYHDGLLRESRTYREFDLRDVAMGIPGAFLIYKAHGDGEILFANDELVRIFECEDINDLLTHVGSSFRTLVHPDDIDRVEESIWDQIHSGTDQLDYVDYRIVTKSGRVKNIVDFGKLVNTPQYGDIFYVFLYDEKDKELALRRGRAFGAARREGLSV